MRRGLAAKREKFFISRVPEAYNGKTTPRRYAYKIQDTGAAGGIVVSPLELQTGARRVAKAENIHRVFLPGLHESFCTNPFGVRLELMNIAIV